MKLAEPISDAALAELDRLHGKATPGIWCEFAGSMTIEADGHIEEEIAQFVSTNRRNNGIAIAELHNAYPLLRERLRVAEREREELRAAVRAHEDSIEALGAQNRYLRQDRKDRDARLKAEGAAEWLRGYLFGLFDGQPEQYKGSALKPLTEELTRLEDAAKRQKGGE